jgi:hypothetical protein
MRQKMEILGLVFGGVGVAFFWVPPIGLAFGVAGLIISVSQYRLQRRYRKTAIALATVGILLFVAFWGTIWVLSP